MHHPKYRIFGKKSNKTSTVAVETSKTGETPESLTFRGIVLPLSHLTNPEPLGLGGLVVRLEDDPKTDLLDLHCLVHVRCLRLRPLSRSSNPDRQIRQVPLCMLMPPHHGPVGAVTSDVALSVSLFGLPYSGGVVALQVRNRGAISSSSGSNTAPLTDGSPYTGGDYFKLTTFERLCQHWGSCGWFSFARYKIRSQKLGR